MPGNGFQNWIPSIYDLNISSQGLHSYQAVGSNLTSIEYQQIVIEPKDVKEYPYSNVENCKSKPIGSHYTKGNFISDHLDSNGSSLNLRSGYSGNISVDKVGSLDEWHNSSPRKQLEFRGGGEPSQEYLTSKNFNRSKFLLDSFWADSPTLTTNSERSEITEASCEFDILGIKHQTSSNQSLGTTKNQDMQQSGYNEMQLLQQNLIYKQIQELQRQQQLQQFVDNRPQNSYNQLGKQPSGSQHSPLINGIPVNDASQLLRSRMQVMEPADARGPLNRSIFAQEHSSVARSVNPIPQHFDIPLGGSPIAEARGGMAQSSYYQGSSSDTNSIYTKNSMHESKGMLLPSGMGKFSSRDQSSIPSEFGVPEEVFGSKQVISEKANEYSVHTQRLTGGQFSRSLQEVNSFQNNSSSLPPLTVGLGEHGWHEMQNDTKQVAISQEMVPLDPLEAKILYNMDENPWDAFGDRSGMMSRSTFGNDSSSNAFSSFQGGSWSALMQSAVAESTSTDTGLQEEWNGLAIHSTDISDHDQTFDIADSERQKANWNSNNLHNAASSSRPFSLINDMASNISGFRHPGSQSSTKLKAHLHQDSFHGSANSFNPQQNQLIEENHKAQMFLQPGNAWSIPTSDSMQSDLQSNKVTSSAFIKFDKGQENTDRVQSLRNDSFHHSNVVANEAYANLKDCYQVDGPVLKAKNAHENLRPDQVKLFGNFPNSVNDGDKSLAGFGGDIRVSRDVRSGLQSNIINQTRSVSTDAFVEDQPNTSPHVLNQSMGFGHGFGLNLSPPSHNRPYTKNVSSVQSPVECSSSYQEEWVDSTSLPANAGVSSNWKVVPPSSNNQNMRPLPASSHSFPIMSTDNDERQENHTPVSCQDNFPILEASTVSQPFPLSNVSHHNESSRNSINPWRSKPNLQSYHAETCKPISQFPTSAELSTKPATSASLTLGPTTNHYALKDKPESLLRSAGSLMQGVQRGGPFVTGVSHNYKVQELPEDLQHKEIINQQESDSSVASFSFQPVNHCSQRNLARFGQGLPLNADASPNVLDVQHGNSSEEEKMHDFGTRFRSSVEHGPNLVTLPNSYGVGETKLLQGFKEDTKTGTALSHASVHANCSDAPLFGHYPTFGDHESVGLPLPSPWGLQSDVLKNGDVVQKIDMVLPKAASLHFSAGRSSEIPDTLMERLDSGQGGSEFSSPRISTLVVTQHAAVNVPPSDTLEEETIVRPKKRKAEVSYPLPWHKEVMQDSRKIDSISVAEQLWARATNRFIEKVEDEVEIYEEIQPIYRSKRRVLLTSQLMQLLLLPLPKSLFSTDFSAANCDTLVYLVSRVSLGDSCSLACSKEISLLSSASDDIVDSEESTMHRRTRDPQLGKTVEGVVSRLKRLEDDFQRLDKSPGIVDLKTELHELEKFSVINRFAKFHGRGPLDSTGTSSISGFPRLNLQRYVTASPLPMNLPEGVQCLPL